MSGPGLDPGRAAEMAIQFQRLEAIYELPGAASLDLAGEAALLAVPASALEELRTAMRERVDSAVLSLLELDEVRASLRSPPADSSIACLGDSLTADHQSWAEMLRGALAAMRPDVGLLNLGRSGDTSMDAIRRSRIALGDPAPSLVVILIGTNDALRYASPPSGLLVSDDETRANLETLAELVAARGARLVWLTPPPEQEDVVEAFPLFRELGLRYRADDVARKAQLVRERPEQVVDLWGIFADRDPDEFLLDDGLHLSPSGHAAVARAVVLAAGRMTG
jgi:lysophospholipase L1-like esterase